MITMPPIYDFSAAFRRLLIGLMLLACLPAIKASVTDLGQTRVSTSVYQHKLNTSAWSQNYLTSFNGWQYIVFYDAGGYVNVGRRELPSGNWETLTTGYKTSSNDGHNNPAIGICPQDGTIHLAYDHHVNDLNYSVSVPNLALNPSGFTWESSLFSPNTDRLIPGTGKIIKVTYPRFVRVPDGRLQFFYRFNRSGGGDTYMYEYSGGSWSELGMVFERSPTVPIPNMGNGTRNAYLNGITYDQNNVLHITWTYRIHSEWGNHDVNYVYSEDYGRTWKINDGTVAGVTGSNPIKPNTPGIVVWPIARTRGLINQCGQAVDQNGRIHVMVWHIPPDAPDVPATSFSPSNADYYHYWRNANGVWSQNRVRDRDRRPKIVFDGNNTLYLISKNWEVYAASEASGWTDWSRVYRNNQNDGGEPVFDPFRVQTDGVLSLGSETTRVRDLQLPVGTATPRAAIPVFEPAAGTYVDSVSIQITCATPQASIYYTTDGSTPTTASPEYTTPFTLTADATVQALATASDRQDSFIASAVYTISTPPPGVISVQSVSASSHDGNVPANSIDGDLGTRWSAQGDGEHITWDLGSIQEIGSVALAWFRGHQRESYFELWLSTDGANWTTALTGTSSGTTTELESFDLSGTARYIRYVGLGNSSNDWNSVFEVVIYRPTMDSSTDTDGDGWPDALEVLLGTSPDSPQDRFRTSLASENDGTLRLRYGPHSDQCTFTVQWTDDLADPNSWQTLSEVSFQGDQAEQVATLPISGDTPVFYRMEITEQ